MSDEQAVRGPWLPPVIAGILEALPHPKQPFPETRRLAFLNALDAAFHVVYDDNENSTPGGN